MTPFEKKILTLPLAALAAILFIRIPTASACTLTRTLQRGSSGADVLCLQQLLSKNKFLTAEPTGYFGTKTKEAIIQFQKVQNISPAIGIVGPLTRSAIAKLDIVQAPITAPNPTTATTPAPQTSTTPIPEVAPTIVATPTLSMSATVTSQPVLPTHRVRAAVDDVGTMTLTADPSSVSTVNAFTITFAGGAVASGSTPFSVSLKSLTGATAQTCTPTTGNMCTVTFSPNFAMTPGTVKTFKVRIDSSNFSNAEGTTDSLSVYLASTSDFTWSDGITSNIPLETGNVPFVIANAIYD